jgi:hypothetical protein
LTNANAPSLPSPGPMPEHNMLSNEVLKAVT